MITVWYHSIDGVYKHRVFKNLDEARAYAWHWIGKHATTSMTFGYAVSDDGIGKITCSGCKINDLFPEE